MAEAVADTKPDKRKNLTAKAFGEQIGPGFGIDPSNALFYVRRLREEGYLPNGKGRRAAPFTLDHAVLIMTAFAASPTAIGAPKAMAEVQALTFAGRGNHENPLIQLNRDAYREDIERFLTKAGFDAAAPFLPALNNFMARWKATGNPFCLPTVTIGRIGDNWRATIGLNAPVKEEAYNVCDLELLYGDHKPNPASITSFRTIPRIAFQEILRGFPELSPKKKQEAP